uniref:Uncharacterized protein n=1 Tax=Anguilla anguilla TaxID=7936 RepID=A0A0E9RSH8_ANGAN
MGSRTSPPLRMLGNTQEYTPAGSRTFPT